VARDMYCRIRCKKSSGWTGGVDARDANRIAGFARTAQVRDDTIVGPYRYSCHSP
jgi:hypothetical protein